MPDDDLYRACAADPMSAGASGAQRSAHPTTPDPGDFRCICDPDHPFMPPDPTPYAVVGCPAHRVRRVYQQWAERAMEEEAAADRGQSLPKGVDTHSDTTPHLPIY